MNNHEFSMFDGSLPATHYGFEFPLRLTRLSRSLEIKEQLLEILRHNVEHRITWIIPFSPTVPVPPTPDPSCTHSCSTFCAIVDTMLHEDRSVMAKSRICTAAIHEPLVLYIGILCLESMALGEKTGYKVFRVTLS